MICKYFLSFCGLSFHFLSDALWSIKFLILIKSKFIFNVDALALSVMVNCVLPAGRDQVKWKQRNTHRFGNKEVICGLGRFVKCGWAPELNWKDYGELLSQLRVLKSMGYKRRQSPLERAATCKGDDFRDVTFQLIQGVMEKSMDRGVCLAGCSPSGYMTKHVCTSLEGDRLVAIRW